MMPRTLKSSMMIYYGLSSVIILFITSMVFLSFLNSQIIKIESDKLQSSVESSADYIALYINNLKKDINLISNIEEVQNFVNEKKASRPIIKNILNNIKQKDEFIERIFIVTEKGRNISTDENITKKMGDNMKLSKWYVDAMNEEVLLNPTREKNYDDMATWVLSLSKNVYGDDNKAALIVVDIKYRALYEYLKTINLGENGKIYVVDNNNNVIFANEIESRKTKRSDILALRNMHLGYNVQESSIYFDKPVKNTNLFIIGVKSGEEIKSLKSRALQIIITSLLITSLTVIYITIKISDRLTNSLNELKQFMQNMDNSLKRIELKEKTYIEIEILKEEINHMIDKIKELKQYEIDSLYSQINPHFLYNTLDILIWMIEFGDNDKAVQITKNLSSFFRISLSQGKRLIPLSNEIEHVKNYLEIQKQRYQSKLEYTINVDEKILDVLVPKIIVQPIVENSIYHGIKELQNQGHIDISAYLDKDIVYIEIKDNGVGMEKSKKNKLRLGGVGMQNIDKRIKYYCGDKCGLQVKETSDKGTTIVLKLKITEN